MDAPTLADRLDRLPRVGLDDLDAAAALLTRRDRKYIVPITTAERLVAALDGRCRVLDIDGRRRFRYESVYFDTPERVSYLGTAYRRRHRFKVRTRTYLDTGQCLLEIKTRDARRRTVKERHDHPLGSRDRLELPDVEVLRAYPLIGDHARALEPVLTTRYSRATLLIDGAGVRATLDTEVRAIAHDGRIAALPGIAIIESKSEGPPSDVDRALWSMGYRPTNVSKFCTSLAALNPGLPANRWTRALRQPWSVAPPSDRHDMATPSDLTAGAAVGIRARPRRSVLVATSA
jgi:hypothetical protein